MRDNKIVGWGLLIMGLFIYFLGAWVGKPETYSLGFFFLAFLAYARVRDQQQLDASSCINCQRTAQFCLGCCDRIGVAQCDSSKSPDQGEECRRLVLGFMLDCNAVGIEQAAKNLHLGTKQAAARLGASIEQAAQP